MPAKKAKKRKPCPSDNRKRWIPTGDFSKYEMPPQIVQLKIIRVLLCLDGKSHLIIRNEDKSIYIDTTDHALLNRGRWVTDSDNGYEQYWEATMWIRKAGEKPKIRLDKRIKDLHWEEDFEYKPIPKEKGEK